MSAKYYFITAFWEGLVALALWLYLPWVTIGSPLFVDFAILASVATVVAMFYAIVGIAKWIGEQT